MSKRRNRESNLSSETIERARQQAAAASEEESPVEEPKAAAPATSSVRNRRRSAAAMAATSGRTSARRDRKIEELSMVEIENLLHNPTKVVSEAELRAQYGYVLNDLRNMALLAAALFVALIVLAFVLL